MKNRILTLDEIQERLKDRRLYIVAEETGLTYPTVKKFAEGGVVNSGIRTIQKISDYLLNSEN